MRSRRGRRDQRGRRVAPAVHRGDQAVAAQRIVARRRIARSDPARTGRPVELRTVGQGDPRRLFRHIAMRRQQGAQMPRPAERPPTKATRSACPRGNRSPSVNKLASRCRGRAGKCTTSPPHRLDQSGLVDVVVLAVNRATAATRRSWARRLAPFLSARAAARPLASMAKPAAISGRRRRRPEPEPPALGQSLDPDPAPGDLVRRTSRCRRRCVTGCRRRRGPAARSDREDRGSDPPPQSRRCSRRSGWPRSGGGVRHGRHRPGPARASRSTPAPAGTGRPARQPRAVPRAQQHHPRPALRQRERRDRPRRTVPQHDHVITYGI